MNESKKQNNVRHQRAYVERRLQAGWRRFSTLLPEEVYREMIKFKQLKMAEWLIKEIQKQSN